MRDRFIREIRPYLSEAQRARLPDALRDIRRQQMLRPENPDGMHYDLDVLPDVTQLYKDATKSGDELARFSDPESLDERERYVLDSVLESLKRYEIELDRLLQRWHRQRWDLRVDQFVASISGNRAAARRAQQRALRHWRAVYTLTEETIQSIGRFVEPVCGSEAKRAWMQRYYNTAFPELLAPESPDLMVQWLREQQIDPAVLDVVESRYNSYLQQREPLREQAKRRMVEARMNRPAMIFDSRVYSLEVGIPDSLADIERRREDLARQTLDYWRGLLQAAVQRRFDAHLEDVLSNPYAHSNAMIRY